MDKSNISFINPKLSNVTRKLESAEYLARMSAINAIQDCEEQGYQSAQLIVDATGVTPEQLLGCTLMAPKGDAYPEADLQRDIGVVRWCLDHREKQQ